MPPPSCATRPPVRPAGRVLAALAAAAALLLGPGAGTASAHDTLIGSTPAADAAVDGAPAEVTLEFGSTPQALGVRVTVAGPDGAPVTRGEPQRRGATVVQDLAADLPAGSYTVQWRVISADGHPLSGTFAFTVAGGVGAGAGTAAAEASGAAGTGDAPAGRAGTDGLATASDGSSLPVVWPAVGAVLVIAAALMTLQLRRPA